MSLSSLIAAAHSVAYDTDNGAVEVTYRGSPINAIVLYGENLDDAGSRESAMANATMWVQVSDVASPDYRDTVVIDSATWRVRRILYGDGNDWKLEIYRDQRPVWT